MVNLPFVDSEMLASWEKAGLQYTFEQEKMNWGDIMISILPGLDDSFLALYDSTDAGRAEGVSFGRVGRNFMPWIVLRSPLPMQRAWKKPR